MSGKIFALMLFWTMPDGQVEGRVAGHFDNVEACVAKAQIVSPPDGLWYCEPGWRA